MPVITYQPHSNPQQAQFLSITISHNSHTCTMSFKCRRFIKARKMDENANLDENFDPDMEVFISYFENLDIMNDYDIYEE